MGIQIKGSNDTISASDGSMVLEGAALTFDNENITGISTMATAVVTSGDLTVGVSTLFADNSTGKTGLGTDVPSSRLQVCGKSTLHGYSEASVEWGDTSNLGALSFTSTTGNPIVRANSGKDLVFQTNGGNTRLTILSDGQVTVGSATEGHADADELTLAGTRTGMTIRSANDDYGNIFFSDATSGTGEYVGAVQYYHADNTLRLKTSSADKLIINSAGDVNITGITTATTFVPTEYQLGNRNILYNGAMQINQYATQVTGLSNYNSYPTCDRWRCIISNGGTYTVEQTDEGPADTGFNHALRFTCTTADNAGQNNLANADGYVAIEQRLEGFDVQGIQKGTTSAKPLAISFWCKSNLTGTYNVEVLDNDNSRRIGSQFTVSSADTWERKTFTFAGDTTGALDNNNGDSLRFRIFLAAGNNFRTGTNSGSWATTTKNQRAQGNVSLSKATSNYFATTGVQMEVGDQPTPFEWIKFGEDLRQCQRYYQEIGTGNFGDYSLGTGYVYNNGNNLALGVWLACPLRASPTVAVTGNMNVRYPAGGSTQVDVNSPSVPSNHNPYGNWLAIGWGITSDIGSNGDLASLNNSNNDGLTISAEL